MSDFLENTKLRVKLQDLNNKAIERKKSQIVDKSIIIDDENDEFDYDQSTIDNLADMNYLIRLEEISNKAVPKVGKDLKFDNKFTKEMMDNYAKLYNRAPVDPVTGEPTGFKYQRPIEDVELIKLNVINDKYGELFGDYINPNPKIIDDAKAEIERLQKEMLEGQFEYENKILPKTGKNMKDSIFDIYIKKKDELNKLLETIDNEEKYLSPRIEIKSVYPKYSEPYKEYLRREENLIDLKNELPDLEKTVENLKNGRIYQDGEKRINFEELEQIRLEEMKKLNNIIEGEKEKEALYLSEVENINKENKKRIEKHRDLLNTLNSGAFNLSQAEGESEEEYLKRLEDTASTPYTENLYFNSKIEQIEKFKKNFKEITKDNSLIEAILNSLSVEDKFLVNKFWANLKRKILNTFGYNNKNVTIEDYIDLMQKFLNEGEPQTQTNIKKDIKNKKQEAYFEELDFLNEKEAQAFNDELVRDILATENEGNVEQQEGDKFIKEVQIDIAENIAGNKQEETANLEITQQGELLLVHSNITQEDIYLKLGTISTTQGLTKLILVSRVSDEGTFNILLDPKINIEIKQTIRDKVITFKKLEIILGLGISKILLELFNIKDKLRDYTTQAWDYLSELYTLEPKIRKTTIRDKAIKNNMVGWGIKNKDIPKEVNFGNVKILLNKLFYKNLLSIKTLSNGNIYGYPVYKVSNNFVENIMKMLKNEKLTKHDINRLPVVEQELYNRLLKLANLNKSHDNNIDSMIKKIKDRVEIITGEIEAGNNNNDLLIELNELILKLVNYGVITQKQAKEHIKTVKRDYF